MASLAEREGLRGKVQCIYIDPPYGIKFNSNFQWSTTNRNVTDGKAEHITREPEQVKAFRDTWRDGIHSYLTYLRDRLTVARDLLTESGSIFVQIGDENVHRVRAVMDEVFGADNFVSSIGFRTAMTKPTNRLNNIFDHILWYTQDKSLFKFRALFLGRDYDSENDIIGTQQLEASAPQTKYLFEFGGRKYNPINGWRHSLKSLQILAKSDRLHIANSLRFIKYAKDFPHVQMDNMWTQQMSEQSKSYVVQTAEKVIQRCILMTTDPGDGQVKEAALSRKAPSEASTYNDIRQGFVYERVPHITPGGGGAIANNAEIDVIHEKFQETLEPLREQLNDALGTSYEEWEIPRDAADAWPEEVKRIHADWWEQRIARQKEIDASIAAKADYEYLYDKPYEDNKKVRVAGPFTVESLSPHRLLGVDEDDELIDNVAEAKLGYGEKQDFAEMILDNLKTSGVQQAHKDDRISFSGIRPWPGYHVCAEGTYVEGDADSGAEKRAGIFVGPEFGTVSRPDLVSAVREAADADFDVLVACAFNYDAHASEFNKLGRVPVLKARMNADLHMAADLKNTGKGNLFVIFGEPDIDILDAEDSQIQVKVNGVDVFHPNTGEIRSDSADGIACWFVDTDYNEESFFVRHAYFLGASDPYKSLRTTLKAEVNQEAWETLHSDTSRPFAKPTSGRIAVKVINHLGDEVMKVFRV